MSETKTTHGAWVQKALEDEFAGKDILRGRHFAAPACFHFQQMAEKLLKAFLVARRKSFPKSHDLIALAGMLESFIPDIKKLKQDLETLNRYYVETRYPADYPEFTFTECEKALQAALRIKEFVLVKLNETNTVGGFGTLGVLIAVTVILALGAGYWAYQNYGPTRHEWVACTQEAKLCPDGSYVSRVAPSCEFAACPGEKSTKSAPPDLTPYVRPAVPEDYTAGWKTYRNEKYGFEVKYPSYWEQEKETDALLKLTTEEKTEDHDMPYGASLTITVKDNVKGLPLREFVAEQKSAPFYYIYDEEMYGLIDGHDSFTGEVINFGMSTLYQTLIAKGDKIFEIAYEHFTPQSLQEAKRIIATFRFPK